MAWEMARRWDIPWSTFHPEKSIIMGVPVPVRTSVSSLETGVDRYTAPVSLRQSGTLEFVKLNTIRDEIAMLATQRGTSPSQLVQQFLWKSLD
jgi:hypothetical protein